MSALAVHKYPVQPGQFSLSLQHQAKALTVRWQEGQGAQMWFAVDPNAWHECRHFLTLATGQPTLPLPGHHLVYVGTFETPERLVFHVFEMLYQSMSETHGERDLAGYLL